MKPYQEEYMGLLRSMAQSAVPPAETMESEAFMNAMREANRRSREAVRRGTLLLREELFPVLDDILSASQEEIDALNEFAGGLMQFRSQKDTGLHYRIHMALLSYARHWKKRDMLIRELYLLGLSLHNLEQMLSPQDVRLYRTRARMYFTEGASYYETEYDQIEDPQTRGYIHRCMGNIALTYDGLPELAEAKLVVYDRSIRILSDPDVRAKTPSLPWDQYLYTVHQQRLGCLQYLRTGKATAEVFAQVLESAQIVHRQQLRAAREQGVPLLPRWQYSYIAAQYHCGAILLPELLDGLYGLAMLSSDDDFSLSGIFCHLGAPAYYMDYAQNLPDAFTSERVQRETARLTQRMLRWLVRAPYDESSEQVMFYLRNFLTIYMELPGGVTFFDLIQMVFAARYPAAFARMWVTGQIARRLCDWAVEDCPERLAGLPDCANVNDVIWRRKALLDFAERAGRLCDVGMVHFLGMEAMACRGLFEEEETLVQLHPYCGASLLAGHPSTSAYAEIAHGHHRHYDEKGGFPLDFSLRESSVAPMISIVAVADAIAAATDEVVSRDQPAYTFEGMMTRLFEEEGKQYAPFAVGLLRDPARREKLRKDIARYTSEAYLELYRCRARAMGEDASEGA